MYSYSTYNSGVRSKKDVNNLDKATNYKYTVTVSERSSSISKYREMLKQVAQLL
jgi:hypothetical protein